MNMRLLIAIGLLLLIINGGNYFSAQAKAPEYVGIPSTRISLLQFDGFEKAETFNGLENEPLGASVMVNELPGSFLAVTKKYNKENFAEKGMDLLDKEEMPFGEYNGILVKGAQETHGVPFEKWLYAFGNEHRTIVIVGNYPKQYAKELSAVVRKIVTSPEYNEHTERNMLEGLPFSINLVQNFKVAQRIQNTLILTINAQFPVTDPDQPVFIVGQSLGVNRIEDHKKFCIDRLMQTKKVKNIKIVHMAPLTVSGLSGYEIKSDAVDEKLGNKVCIYQAMLFDKESYYIMQGFCGESTYSKTQEAFKMICRSFRLNG